MVVNMEGQGKRKATAGGVSHDDRAAKLSRSDMSPRRRLESTVVEEKGTAGSNKVMDCQPGNDVAINQVCGISVREQSSPSSQEGSYLLPSQLMPGKKGTLVLDMDKTLIFKEWRLQRADQRPQVVLQPDFVFKIIYRGYAVEYHVKQRPHLFEFLHKASELFEVVLFTASESLVTLPVVEKLDPKHELIHHVLCRNSCTEVATGSFVKDLSRLGRDLSKVVIVDDNPDSFMWHQENAILIGEYGGWEADDTELASLIPVLGHLAEAEDVRTVVSELTWDVLACDKIVSDEDAAAASHQDTKEDSQEDSEDSTVYL